MTIPSSHITAMWSFLDDVKGSVHSVHGSGGGVGSKAEGTPSITVFINILRPAREVLSGPLVPRIASLPRIAKLAPTVGNRSTVGLSPKIPLFADGDRMPEKLDLSIGRR